MDKSLIRQILLDQAQEPLPTPLVTRRESDQLEHLINNPQAIILSGVRRCGKSTLLQMIRKKQTHSDYYINFDDDRLVQFTVEDFQGLIEVFIELYGLQDTFYFDEIQNILGWERFVRRLHNERKKVFITGSNASLLSAELGTHLTGRHIPIVLYPYSFHEYLSKYNTKLLGIDRLTSTELALVKKYFSEYKVMGGFPEYLDNKQKKYLHALYENILYKDIVVRHKLPQAKPILEMVYYLASNNAKEFTYNSLRKLLGLSSANTVSEYCHYLENSFLCFALSRFSYSLKKQIHYAKKIYFIDQALAEAVGFRFSEDQGRTLENIVFLELKRRSKDIFFHKEEQECDFVIREGYNVSEVIQVSVSLQDEKTKSREVNGLIEAMDTYQLKKGIILTEDESGSETITKNNITFKIEIIPCWKWLLTE